MMFVWSLSLLTLTEMFPHLGHENTLGSVRLTVLIARFLLLPNFDSVSLNKRVIKCLPLWKMNVLCLCANKC